MPMLADDVLTGRDYRIKYLLEAWQWAQHCNEFDRIDEIEEELISVYSIDMKTESDHYLEKYGLIINSPCEEKKQILEDNINHPSHYAEGRKYEPIDVIDDWNLNFALGNTVKYISRAGRKRNEDTLKDLKKAAWYLDYEIKKISGQNK